MPIRITNEIVDVPLNGGMVKGILSGDEAKWSFQSLNRDFLALFPGGIVCSHTYLDAGTLHYEHHKFQLAIAGHVKEIIAERTGPKMTPPPIRPVAVPRRYVAP